MPFITVYSKTTGRQQRIPDHWLGNPVLSRDFRKTPPPAASQDAAESGAPSKSANKSEWIDYAVDQGTSRDDAEALTKAELIETYGN